MTLVELLVATGAFATFAVGALATLVAAGRLERDATGRAEEWATLQQAAQQFVLDLRLADGIGNYEPGDCPEGSPGQGTIVVVTQPAGRVAYCLVAGELYRREGAGTARRLAGGLNADSEASFFGKVDGNGDCQPSNLSALKKKDVICATLQARQGARVRAAVYLRGG